MIYIDSVSKIHRSTNILENISFKIERQEIVVVIGPSGAGKTTLAKILLQLDQPTTGSVKFDSALNFAYLPQKIALNNFLTIDANTLFHYLVGGQQVEAALMKDIVHFADLERLAKRQIRYLSGGELRKLLIASTLARAVDCIVFDEPTQNLDLDSQQYFYQLLQKLRTNTKTSFVLISHDLHTVMRYADQVLCLNHHLCCFGKPSDTLPGLSNMQSTITSYQHLHDHSHVN